MPVAMRVQLNSCGSLLMPSTIQTSPIHVQIAARSPPSKKSKPPRRIQERYGFLSGAVMTSVTNAPGLPIRRGLVLIISNQRRSLSDCTKSVRISGSLFWAINAPNTSMKPSLMREEKSLTAVGSPAGIRSRRWPSAVVSNFVPSIPPITPTTNLSP